MLRPILDSLFHYNCCGLRIASVFEIPGFPQDDDQAEADVVIRRGDVPEQLPEAAYRRANYDADEGVVLLKTDGARFLVRDGNSVLVRHPPAMSPAGVATYLSGSVLAALLHQRGALPLHAGCVRVGDGAVGFAGRSGAGKSTLMGALELRGLPVLAEDVTAIRFASDGRKPMAAPGVRRLKLNTDSAAALGLDTSQATLAENTGKHLWITDPGKHLAPAPLRRLCVLDPKRDPNLPPSSLGGLERLETLRRFTHRWGIAVAMGVGDDNMKLRVRLAEHIDVCVIGRPTDWADLPRWLDRLEGTLLQDLS